MLKLLSRFSATRSSVWATKLVAYANKHPDIAMYSSAEEQSLLREARALLRKVRTQS
jgi:hypothetical protein